MIPAPQSVAVGRGRGHVPPGASGGGAERGCGIFLRKEIYKNYVRSVEAGMGMEEQIMCIKMSVLDVTSSVSRSSKCMKIVGSWGFVPGPTEKACNVPPDP